jgi:hypothetical protein
MIRPRWPGLVPRARFAIGEDGSRSSGRERQLLDSVRHSEAPIDASNLALIAALVGIAALVAGLLALRRASAADRRLAALTRGADGDSLEHLLAAHVDKVFAVARELESVAARTTRLEEEGQRAVSRLGLVRFNPFDDTGGNQSFVVAALDARGDGVVMTSLHSRNGTRVYAKGVRGGQADASLSDEEAEALRLARARE